MRKKGDVVTIWEHWNMRQEGEKCKQHRRRENNKST